MYEDRQETAGLVKVAFTFLGELATGGCVISYRCITNKLKQPLYSYMMLLG